jgi:septal ring factor EnvC (AmiA/AmiB activator)
VDDLEGSCVDVMSGEKGNWSLKRAALLGSVSAELRAELFSWAEIRRELDRTEQELELLRRKSDSQQASIDTFQRYVLADDALKQKAESRLGSTSSAIQELRAQADGLRARLDESLRMLETAERLSPAGSLVLGSRESIERESRWIELTLRLLAPETSPGFEQSLERAERVKALQDKIAAERRKIRELENAGDLVEYQQEEEFYREMGQ